MDWIRKLQAWLESLDRSARGRLAIAAVGAAGILVSIGWIVREFGYNTNWPEGTDMGLYLAAADAVSAGQSPYTNAFHRYPYPPLFADFLAVLAAVLRDPVAVTFVWVAVSVVAAIVSIALVCKAFGPRIAIPWIVFFSGVVLLGRSARTDLYHGQLNFPLLLLLVAGFLAWRNGRNTLASVLWAIMMCGKPFLGIVVFFMARQGDWAGAARTVIMGATLFALSFLPFLGNAVEVFGDWREATQHYASAEWAVNPLNQSFHGLTLRLFTDNEFSRPWIVAPGLAAFLVAALGLIAAIVIFAGTAGRSKEEPGEYALLRLGIMIGGAMSVGPILEGDHLFFMLPGAFGAWAIAWCKVAIGAPRAGLWLAVSVAWAAALLPALSPWRLIMHFADPATWDRLQGVGILLSGFVAFALLAAVVLSTIALRQEGRHDTRTLSTAPTSGAV
jgi:hypothetical protein